MKFNQSDTNFNLFILVSYSENHAISMDYLKITSTIFSLLAMQFVSMETRGVASILLVLLVVTERFGKNYILIML
jgi:hypothetical protein